MEAKPQRVYSSMDAFSSFDSKNSSDVLSFQKLYNTTQKPGKPLFEDGIYGPATNAAYVSKGFDYNKQAPKKTGEPKPAAQTTTSEPAAEETVSDTKKESFIDKFKSLSTTKKVIVVAVPVIAIGIAIYLIRRKK